MEHIFKETLEREGKTIIINGKEYRVFFRLHNDKQMTDNYYIMYADKAENINQGDVYKYGQGSEQYFVLKKMTVENDIYQKYICVKANQSVKFNMSDSSTIYDIDMFMLDNLMDKLNVNTNIITLGSTADFIVPLNSITKKIKINNRFFCGSFHATWKVVEMNIKNNLLMLYCERGLIEPKDIPESGIAKNFDGDITPNIFNITMKTDYTLKQDDIVPLEYTITKNNEPYTITAPFTIVSNTDSSVANIEENSIVAYKDGESTILLTYKEKETDKCNVVTVNVKVGASGVITVTPPYDIENAYELIQYDTVTVKAEFNNPNPKWKITLLNSSDIPSDKYSLSMDNTSGSFTVTNNKGAFSTPMQFEILEELTQTFVLYNIKLASMW